MPKRLVHTAVFFIFIFFACTFYSCNPEPVETSLVIPVEFSNVPGHMILTGFHTDKIELRVKADPELIKRIDTQKIHYPVDLYTDLEFDPAGDSDSIEPGAYLIPVEKQRLPIRPAIRVLSINPSYLSVQLETKVTKSFQVNVQYRGKPPEGYIALEAATTPAFVELTGAQSQIEAIKQLKTKPIDLSRAKENFKKEIPLDLDSPEKISASQPIIVVTVPIRQQLVTKTLESVKIQALNTTYKTRIEPARISVTLKGPFEIVNNHIMLQQIHSFIDLKGLAPGVYTRHATINIPVDLMMTDASPKVFTIKLE